jgi:cytoplasmic tRNA 2-thiolation protein 1
MTLLNERYDYGLDLQLLSIDEGISGYRDDSLLTVQRNSEQYKLPLKILSYADLYEGWTMDKVVKETGKKGNCTYCGVFRRKALDLGGDVLQVEHIVTGHNADDVAETVLMNGELVLSRPRLKKVLVTELVHPVLRGDIARVERCTEITTGSGDKGQAVKRSKPFKYAYEKEIVMYAYFKVSLTSHVASPGHRGP